MIFFFFFQSLIFQAHVSKTQNAFSPENNKSSWPFLQFQCKGSSTGLSRKVIVCRSEILLFERLHFLVQPTNTHATWPVTKVLYMTYSMRPAILIWVECACGIGLNAEYMRCFAFWVFGFVNCDDWRWALFTKDKKKDKLSCLQPFVLLHFLYWFVFTSHNHLNLSLLFHVDFYSIFFHSFTYCINITFSSSSFLCLPLSKPLNYICLLPSSKCSFSTLPSFILHFSRSLTALYVS